MDTLKLFGQHLRVIRKARNLTQEALAHKAGMNYPHVGAIERGQKNVSLLTIEKLAKGLNIPMSELLALPNSKDPKAQVIALISQATPKKQKAVLIAVKAMLT